MLIQRSKGLYIILYIFRDVRQASMSLQEYDNKENIIPKVKIEDKKGSTVEDPKIESLSWYTKIFRFRKVYYDYMPRTP
jgi:hypothetical protein